MSVLLVHLFELCAKGDYTLAADLARVPELTPLERSLRVRAKRTSSVLLSLSGCLLRSCVAR